MCVSDGTDTEEHTHTFRGNEKLNVWLCFFVGKFCAHLRFEDSENKRANLRCERNPQTLLNKPASLWLQQAMTTSRFFFIISTFSRKEVVSLSICAIISKLVLIKSYLTWCCSGFHFDPGYRIVPFKSSLSLLCTAAGFVLGLKLKKNDSNFVIS